MKQILPFVIAACSWAATTTVTQPVVNPDGTPAAGTVYIRASAACQSGTDYVGAGTVTVKFSNGSFTVNLVPNDTCGGTTYTASWETADGATWIETWSVPTSATPVAVDSVVVGRQAVPSWITQWFSQNTPSPTAVAQTILNPDGSPASGQVLIRLTAACTAGTVYVAAKTLTLKFTAGVFSTQLMPNDTCVPQGTSYTATWTLTGGRMWTETWVVPTSSAPVSVSSLVQMTGIPAPPAQLQPSQIAQGGATAGQVLGWSGTSWSPTGIAAPVTSVFGRTGSIVKQTGDYLFADIGGLLAHSQLAQNGAAINQVLGWTGSAWAPQNQLLTSVFGRTGAVAAQSGDYTFSQIGGSLGLAQIAQGGASTGWWPAWNGSAWAPTKTFGFGNASITYDIDPQAMGFAPYIFASFTPVPTGVAPHYWANTLIQFNGSSGSPTSTSSNISVDGDGQATLSGFVLSGYVSDQLNGTGLPRWDLIPTGTGSGPAVSCDKCSANSNSGADPDLFVISYYMTNKIAGSAGTMNLVITWNDGNSTRTYTTPSLDLTALNAYVQGTVTVSLSGGQALTIQPTYTGAAGNPRFNAWANIR